MQDAAKAGKVRAIGVSNFEKEDLQNILESCKIKPMVNQAPAHDSNTPFDPIKYTQEQGILVEAYSPVAQGAKYAMPIHWGAFRLSSHPWDDSAVRLVKAAEGSDTIIATPMIGETMNLNDVEEYQTRWYEDIE